MIEPVGARSTTQLQEIYDRFAQNGEAGPGEVRPGDQQRFEVALAGSADPARAAPAAEIAETQVAQLQPTDPWVMAPPSGSVGPTAPNLGERILDSMTNLREGWSETGKLVDDMMSRPGFTMVEMVHLQVQVQQTTVMMQLLSQEVGTVSQKIDGLLKSG